MREKMKNLINKRTLIFAAAVFFLAAVCVPVVFAQTTQAEIQFVQKLSAVLENGTVEQALDLFNSIP